MSDVSEPLNAPLSYPVADGETVYKNRRVKLNANGTVQHAGAADLSIGVSNSEILPDNTDGINPAQPRGRNVSVTNWNTRGSLLCVAAGAISPGDEVQAAANGKVASGAGLKMICVQGNVTADGQSVMVVPAK